MLKIESFDLAQRAATPTEPALVDRRVAMDELVGRWYVARARFFVGSRAKRFVG